MNTKKELIKNGVPIPEKLMNELTEKEKLSQSPYSILCPVLTEEWESIVNLVTSFGCAPLKRFN